jgi:O-antigen ligase
MCVAAAVVWSFMAFAGVYTWTLAPLAVLVLLATALLHPPILSEETRVLDGALIVGVAWVWLQAVPLPVAVRSALSPHAAATEAVLRFESASRRAAPLSLDAQATLIAASTASLVLLTFWAARAACARGGVRSIVRTIAWTGLAGAVAAVLIRATSPGWLFGMPPNLRNWPYGPFVNRNHMGTWLLLTTPMTVGYMFARIDDRASRSSAAAAVDARMVWLLAAAAAMTVAIVMSLSRSTAVGLAAACVFGSSVALGRHSRARWMLLAALAVGAALILLQPQTLLLIDRFQNSRTTAAWSRIQIWRETIPIVRDFIVTGVGAGAYRAAMIVYQQTDRTLFFNQAHNHYLQVAAEGGMMLTAAVAVAAVAWVRQARAWLRADRSAMFWIRAGAAASVAAVAVQSLWETGLRMPANGVLFAVACAVAVHADRAPES